MISSQIFTYNAVKPWGYFMRKLYIKDQEVIVTCSRNVDWAGFQRACASINDLENECLLIKKSSLVLISQKENEYFVIERMNTDTFTLHIHYNILNQQVYKV